MATVTLPSNEITDRETFHSVCHRVFGFPAFYGRNMDARLDCMSCLDDPNANLSSFSLEPGELLLVMVPDSRDFEKRVPEVFTALIEGTAAANRRFVARGLPPLIGLVFA